MTKHRDTFAWRAEHSRNVESIAWLWCRWNIKQITSDQFVAQVENIIKPNIERSWGNYLKGQPLRELLVMRTLMKMPKKTA